MTGASDANAAKEREALDLDRLALAETDLAAVEHAMSRLDAGTWGTCDVCAEPIEAAVLERRPVTRACAVHT